VALHFAGLTPPDRGYELVGRVNTVCTYACGNQ